MNDPRQEPEDVRRAVASASAPKSAPGGERDVVRLEVISENGYRELRARQNSGQIQYGRLTAPVSARGDIEITLGYRRCLDFDSINGAGQDFALVRADIAHGVGVVADGVSQSFFGDIAARYVSLYLAQTLWETRANPPSEETLEEELRDLEAKVSEEVQRYQLPTHLPDMQVAALERARVRGSQTVFAAFVLDLKTGGLSVYILGDADAVVRLAEGNVPLKRDTKGRWSSAGNSRYGLIKRTFRTCEGIVLKSDGAGEAWGQNLGESGAVCEPAFVRLAGDQASKDDVAFVGINLSGSAPEPGSPESLKRHLIPETPAARPAETQVQREIQRREHGQARLSTRALFPVRYAAAIALLTGMIVGCILTLAVQRLPLTSVRMPGRRGAPAPLPPQSPPPPAQVRSPQREPSLLIEQQELNRRQFASLDGEPRSSNFGDPPAGSAKVRIVLIGVSADKLELQPSSGKAVIIAVPARVHPEPVVVDATVPCNCSGNAKTDVRFRIFNGRGEGYFEIQPNKFYVISVRLLASLPQQMYREDP